MKNKSTKFLAVLLAGALLFSCKKEDNNVVEPISILQAKWNMSRIYFESMASGVLDSSSFSASIGDYVDFRKDGKAYIRFTNPLNGTPELDTTAYSLLGTNKLIFNDGSGPDTLDIYQLTNSNLEFGSYDEYTDAQNYSKSKIYCSK